MYSSYISNKDKTNNLSLLDYRKKIGKESETFDHLETYATDFTKNINITVQICLNKLKKSEGEFSKVINKKEYKIFDEVNKVDFSEINISKYESDTSNLIDLKKELNFEGKYQLPELSPCFSKLKPIDLNIKSEFLTTLKTGVSSGSLESLNKLEKITDEKTNPFTIRDWDGLAYSASSLPDGLLNMMCTRPDII